jgi:hypothetical protein
MIPPASRIPRGVVRAFLGGLLLMLGGLLGTLIERLT